MEFSQDGPWRQAMGVANAQAQQRLLEVEASAMGKAPRRVGRGPTQKKQENLQICLLKLFF